MTKKLKDSQRAVLEKLSRAKRLTPDNVIAEARDPKSPLHSYFQWDVAKAAAMAWRAQARELISSFKIIVVRNQVEYNVQAFVERPNKKLGTQGYVAFEDVRKSPKLARRFMDDELRAAISYVDRARAYAGALGLEKRIEAAIESLNDLRDSLRSAVQ